MIKKFTLFLVLASIYFAPSAIAQNVGIGQSNPQEKLDVNGNIRVVGNLWLRDATRYIGTQTNHNLHFRTNNIDRISILNTGNIGIGTAAPTAVFHVNGSVRFQNLTTGSQTNALMIDGNGNVSTRTMNINNWDAAYSWGNHAAAGYLTVEVDPTWDGAANTTSNVGRTGNVGIGTLTPGAKLDVNGRIRLVNAQTEIYGEGSRLKVRAENTDDVAQFASYGLYLPRTGHAYNLYASGGIQMGYNESNSPISFRIGDLRFLADATERVRITSGGNVGIGTNAPTQMLDVNGQVRIRGGNPAEGKILYSEADGTGVWKREGTGEYNDGSVAAGNWYRIAQNSGNRANAEFTLRDYISGGGHSTLKFIAGISYGRDVDMSITVTSHSKYYNTTFSQIRVLRNGTYDPMYLEVYVARGGSVDYSILKNLQSSGWTPIDWIPGSVPAGYTERVFQVDNLFMVGDYQNRFTVSRGGNAELNGRFKSNGINETSDIRFKKNIEQLESCLDKVLLLRGVKYEWRNDEFPEKTFKEGFELGLIAQEIEEIFPEVVETDADGYKSVQYSHLVAVLIEAIKEQQILLEKKDVQIGSLESKIDENQEQLNRVISAIESAGIPVEITVKNDK